MPRGQSLAARPHARDGTHLGLSVGARREEPAIQRGPERSADGLDPEPGAMNFNVFDRQRRVGSSRAAEQADAELNISFARRSSAFSRRSFLNSSHPPGSAVFAVSERSRHRRNEPIPVATPEAELEWVQRSGAAAGFVDAIDPDRRREVLDKLLLAIKKEFNEHGRLNLFHAYVVVTGTKHL